MVDANELADALDDAAINYVIEGGARSYSGRAMYGKECVSCSLEYQSDLWNLCKFLTNQGVDVPQPSTDSLGMGIVAYWRNAEWPEGRSEWS